MTGTVKSCSMYLHHFPYPGSGMGSSHVMVWLTGCRQSAAVVHGLGTMFHLSKTSMERVWLHSRVQQGPPTNLPMLSPGSQVSGQGGEGGSPGINASHPGGR